MIDISTDCIIYPVLPRKPSNVRAAKIMSHSVTLNWEQEYECAEEKATKYHIQVAGKLELSRIIDHTFGDTSPSQCEHTVTGLTPGQTYSVVIIAGNESGTAISDEVSMQAFG